MQNTKYRVKELTLCVGRKDANNAGIQDYFAYEPLAQRRFPLIHRGFQAVPHIPVLKCSYSRVWHGMRCNFRSYVQIKRWRFVVLFLSHSLPLASRIRKWQLCARVVFVEKRTLRSVDVWSEFARCHTYIMSIRGLLFFSVQI